MRARLTETITEAELELLQYLRSGVDFEAVSESHEACQMIAAVCEENASKRLYLVGAGEEGHTES
jgi:hypothetical protein